VNKRTARLAANIPLIKNNLKPLSFIDVSAEDYVYSLLGIYEKNDVSLLRDLYKWAYQRSSERYSAFQQAMGEPNVFKLKYRSLIQNIVRTLVTGKVPRQELIEKISENISKAGLSKFDTVELRQVIENEIVNLHEGNIARFKIRPSEFEVWKKLR
jgi:Fic family protein